MKLYENIIHNALMSSLRKIIKEDEERDSYVNGGIYTIDNPNDLKAMFFDKNNQITKGQFVMMSYIKEAKINKSFNNGGFNSEKDGFTSADDLVTQGRGFNKKYANSFYDSDEFNSKRSKSRGAKIPFAIFEVVTQELNWAVDKYGEYKDAENKIFNDASDEDLDSYTKNNADYARRRDQFIMDNPDMSDEMNQYTTYGTPRDVVDRIRQTKLRDAGGGWNPVDGNPYVYKHDKTQNEGLRLTISPRHIRSIKYYALMDDKLYTLPEDEYWHWKKAFGTSYNPDKNKVQTVVTNIDQLLNKVRSSYDFKNYLLPQIATLTFTVNGKKVKYINRNLTLPKTSIVVDAESIERAPVTENRMRRKRFR